MAVGDDGYKITYKGTAMGDEASVVHEKPMLGPVITVPLFGSDKAVQHRNGTGKWWEFTVAVYHIAASLHAAIKNANGWADLADGGSGTLLVQHNLNTPSTVITVSNAFLHAISPAREEDAARGRVIRHDLVFHTATKPAHA